jgi:hypothetical protein
MYMVKTQFFNPEFMEITFAAETKSLEFTSKEKALDEARRQFEIFDNVILVEVWSPEIKGRPVYFEINEENLLKYQKASGRQFPASPL